jgi:hypothetical protein
MSWDPILSGCGAVLVTSGMANPRASHGAYQPGKLPVNISEYIYIYMFQPWSWLLWVFTLFLIHIPISLDQIPIIRYKSPIDSHRTIGWCWLSITNNNSWTMLNVMFKNSKTAHFPIPWVMENSIEKSPVIHVVPWIIHDYSHSHQFHPFFLLSNPQKTMVSPSNPMKFMASTKKTKNSQA